MRIAKYLSSAAVAFGALRVPRHRVPQVDSHHDVFTAPAPSRSVALAVSCSHESSRRCHIQSPLHDILRLMPHETGAPLEKRLCALCDTDLRVLEPSPSPYLVRATFNRVAGESLEALNRLTGDVFCAGMPEVPPAVDDRAASVACSVWDHPLVRGAVVRRKSMEQLLEKTVDGLMEGRAARRSGRTCVRCPSVHDFVAATFVVEDELDAPLVLDAVRRSRYAARVSDIKDHRALIGNARDNGWAALKCVVWLTRASGGETFRGGVATWSQPQRHAGPWIPVEIQIRPRRHMAQELIVPPSAEDLCAIAPTSHGCYEQQRAQRRRRQASRPRVVDAVGRLLVP